MLDLSSQVEHSTAYPSHFLANPKWLGMVNFFGHAFLIIANFAAIMMFLQDSGGVFLFIPICGGLGLSGAFFWVVLHIKYKRNPHFESIMIERLFPTKFTPQGNKSLWTSIFGNRHFTNSPVNYRLF